MPAPGWNPVGHFREEIQVQYEETRRRGPRRRVAFVACLAIVLAACSILLAACGGGGSSSSSESTGASESSAEETETTSGESSGGGGEESESSGEPIGIAGLEGEVTEGGADFMKGMNIGVKEINENGGINGRQIDLKIFKTGGTPQGASSAYQQAGAESNIIGGFLGATGNLAIREQSERVKLPLIAASGNDKIDTPVTKYIFENSAGGEYATSGLVYMAEHGPEYAKAFGREWTGGTGLQGKKVAVFHTESDFGQQIPIALGEACEVLGCEISDDEEGSATESVEALTPQLTKMKESGADIYYIEGLNPNAFAAAKQLGLSSKPIISDQNLTVPALAEATGANGEGVVFGAHKCADTKEIPASDPTRKWCEEYRAKFEKYYPNEVYAQYSIYGYDAVTVYAWAVEEVEKAGEEVNRETVVEKMQELNGTLRTSHGLPKTSSESHRLVGSWKEAYVNMVYSLKGGKAVYELAPDTDPSGAESIGEHAELASDNPLLNE
jgi:branched-chain amino acid transport system substrate-binding protein